MLVFGFGNGVFVSVIDDVFDQPTLVLFLLVVGRRSYADVNDAGRQFSELHQRIAKD